MNNLSPWGQGQPTQDVAPPEEVSLNGVRNGKYPTFQERYNDRINERKKLEQEIKQAQQQRPAPQSPWADIKNNPLVLVSPGRRLKVYPEEYPDVYPELPTEFNDESVAEGVIKNELRRRYNTSNLKKTMGSYAGDIGLQDYNIAVNTKKDLTNRGIWGEYKADNGSIDISNAPGNPKIATGVHELQHAFDDVYSPRFRVTDGVWDLRDPEHHHNDMPLGFEREMASLLTGQRQKESGIPLDPRMLDYFPQLENVQSLSSNKLAINKPDPRYVIPPKIKNAMWGRE